MSEFLAEASILIQANTVAFKEELASALATVPKAIEIPIIATAVTGTGASAAATLAASVSAGAAASGGAADAAVELATASDVATKALQAESTGAKTTALALAALAFAEHDAAASAAVAGAAQQELTNAQIEASQINRLFLATEEALAKARLDVVGAASAQQEAEIRLSREVAAGAAARELLTQAQLRGLDVQGLLTNETVAAAVALGEQAAAATEDAAALERTAAASEHAAVAQKNLARGAATSALASAGLRGATLTANASFIAGAASAILFGKSVQTAAKFETSLNVFKVTAQATADEMGRVSEAAQQLGRDVTLPGVSAQDAADAMTNLAKAGLSVQESIDGARGVLQLATAAQIDNAQATELTAGALNAFGLSGKQAVAVADLLANASIQAQGSISDMGLALSQSEAVARQVGVSIRDTVALITLLAKSGLRGSDAGTALRTAFIKLINPTKKAQEVIDRLGLTIRDAQGNVRPEVFADFADKTARLSAAQRDAAAATIFGQDSIRALAILARDGSAGLNDMRVAVEKQGSAAELAAAQNTGLNGQINNLKNQLDAAGLAAGELALGPLTALVGVFADNVQATEEFIKTLQRIPSSIGVTVGLDFVFGGGGGGKQGDQSAVSKFFDKVKDNIRESAGKALTSTVIERAVPGGQRTIDILNALFPPEETKRAGERSGAEIRSAIEDASREAVKSAQSAGPVITSALDHMFAMVSTALQQGISKARRGVFQAIQAASGQQAGLEEILNQIVAAGGSPQQQIANLQKQAAVQSKIIADAGPKAAGDALKARRAAAAKLAAINGQITTLQGQITAAQKAAADKQVQDAKDAQAARDKADQAILDSFAPGQNRIALAETRAGATDSVKQAEAVQVLIANTASAEIAAIEKSVKNVKTRNSEIAKRVQILVAAGAELDRLEKQAADALAQKKADTFQAQVDLAAAEGNIPLQIRFNNIRIRAIDKLIASGKQVGAALNRLKTEREQRKQDNENLQNQAIQDQIALGQSIQDLTGNKNPLVNALNRAIAETRQDIAAAKRAGRSTTVLQTELNNFLKQRKDAIEGAKDEVKNQTTAFDLLKEAADTFNQNAGNLINPNQPFAGPTGFTADIAQFLIRRQKPTTPTAAGPTAGPVPPVQLQDQPLIQAIEKLTDAIIGSTGNSSTATGTASARQSRVWHSENMIARRFQEA